MNDGWDIEDDDLGLLDDDDDEEDEVNQKDVAAHHPPTSSSSPTISTILPSSSFHLPDNAWEEDDDLLDLLEEEEEATLHTHHLHHPPRQTHHQNEPPQTYQQTTTAPAQTLLAQELGQYIASLSSLIPIVNKTLQNDLNTWEKAHELVEYYRKRPQLVNYTLETELPRMNYRLTDMDGAVVNDKAELAQRLQYTLSVDGVGDDDGDEILSILIRSANQSLLADPLSVLTHGGQNSMVRSAAYGATCVGHDVSFQIHLLAMMVQVQANLHILVPTSSGGRQVVAQVFMNVAFGPAEPVVEYRITHVELVENWQALIEPWAQYLLEHNLLMQNDDEVQVDDYRGDNASDFNFRDVFLQRSQSLWHSSAVQGMQLAWNEVQAATGLQTKRLPSFLPKDVLQQAAHEEQQQQQWHQQQKQGYAPEHRPTSILGGLVKKGWTKLAESVALPEEDESLYQGWQPSLASTQHHSQQQPGPPLFGHLQRREQQQQIVPQLYQRQEQTHPSRSQTNSFNDYDSEPSHKNSAVVGESSLRLYRTEDSDNKVINKVQLYRKEKDDDDDCGGGGGGAELRATLEPQLHRQDTSPSPTLQLYRKEEPNARKIDITGRTFPSATANDIMVADGWDDDDVDVAIDDDNDIDFEHGEEPMNKTPQQSSLSDLTPVDHRNVVVGFHYDPETDIRPTRKRWINPFPGPRKLELMHG